MGSQKYIKNINRSNTEVLEHISREFIAAYSRGVTCQNEILIGVEVAKINELANNNFDPERFKRSLTKVIEVVASDVKSIDDLYLIHCLNSPV